MRISVRTLLPLAHFLTARSSSLEEIGDACAASGDVGSPDLACPERNAAAPNSTSGLEEAFAERQNADRMRHRRHGEKDGAPDDKGAR